MRPRLRWWAKMSDIKPARRLGAIQADVIDIRGALRRRKVPEDVLDQIWSLTNEAFRRGCEYAVEQEWVNDGG